MPRRDLDYGDQRRGTTAPDSRVLCGDRSLEQRMNPVLCFGTKRAGVTPRIMGTFITLDLIIYRSVYSRCLGTCAGGL